MFHAFGVGRAERDPRPARFSLQAAEWKGGLHAGRRRERKETRSEPPGFLGGGKSGDESPHWYGALEEKNLLLFCRTAIRSDPWGVSHHRFP